MPAAARPHVRQHRARDVQQPQHIGVEDIAHFVGAAFLDGAEQAIAGVIDQYVDAAEVFHGQLRRAYRRCFVSHVEPRGQ